MPRYATCQFTRLSGPMECEEKRDSPGTVRLPRSMRLPLFSLSSWAAPLAGAVTREFPVPPPPPRRSPVAGYRESNMDQYPIGQLLDGTMFRPPCQQEQARLFIFFSGEMTRISWSTVGLKVLERETSSDREGQRPSLPWSTRRHMQAYGNGLNTCHALTACMGDYVFGSGLSHISSHECLRQEAP